MQLTAKEWAVRDHLIEQLRRPLVRMNMDGLSYAEKKHIEKGLDLDYLENALINMRRNARSRIRWLVVGALFISMSVVYTGFGFPSAFEGYWAGVIEMFLVESSAVAAYLLYRGYRSRWLIYEQLRILAMPETEVTRDLMREAYAGTAG